MFCKTHAGVIGNDLDVARDVGDVEIARSAAVRFDRRALGNHDFHVRRERARCPGEPVLIVVDGDRVGVAGHLKGGFLIGTIGATSGPDCEWSGARSPSPSSRIDAGDAGITAKALDHDVRRFRNGVSARQIGNS